MTLDNFLDIKTVYQSKSNKEAALKMAAYMKNQFPFLGVHSPQRTELNKVILAQFGKPDLVDIEPLVYALWDLPEREYQYFAIALLNKIKNELSPSHIEFILDLIKSKSWWDTIDALAPGCIGSILYNYPDLQKEYIDNWVSSDNIWINRTAILFQLKYKEETDFELLKSIILSLSHKKDFFVKKAIGWALREYSKKEAILVEEFISNSDLQPLSIKEGMKYIESKRP